MLKTINLLERRHVHTYKLYYKYCFHTKQLYTLYSHVLLYNGRVRNIEILNIIVHDYKVIAINSLW